MKAYTDLEQSKKLAEILPIESADMAYLWHSTSDNPTWRYDDDMSPMVLGNVPINELTCDALPCWSLAALLSILPIVYINNEKEVCGPLHIDITDSETPFVLWYVNLFHKGNIVEIQTKEYDNLVDACVEMITKLHEQKLL